MYPLFFVVIFYDCTALIRKKLCTNERLNLIWIILNEIASVLGLRWARTFNFSSSHHQPAEMRVQNMNFTEM